MAADSLDDSASVLRAARLGWALIECSYRWQTELTRASENADLPDFPTLQGERSGFERAVEVANLVAGLLEGAPAELGVNCKISEIIDQKQTETVLASAHISTLTREISGLMKKEQPPGDDLLASRRRELAHFLFGLDLKVQDRMAPQATSLADGYQLGKGFAEIYWVPKTSVDSGADVIWTAVLGAKRGRLLQRLLNRCESCYDSISFHALSFSLWA